MRITTFPGALYDNSAVKKLLYNGGNCILYKKLTSDSINKEKICVSHSLVFITTGTLKVETADGRMVVAGDNEIIFMPRDTYIISDFTKSEGFLECFIAFFDHDVVNRFSDFSKIEGLNQPGLSGICSLEASPRIKSYFENIKGSYFDSVNDHRLLEIKIIELLQLLLLESDENFVRQLCYSEFKNKNRTIESLMLRHINTNMTVADFARLSGRSLSTFNRHFKSKYDESPKQWLKIERWKKHQAC